jgi:hypothetical protein
LVFQDAFWLSKTHFIPKQKLKKIYYHEKS